MRDVGDNISKILPKPKDEEEYELHYDFVIYLLIQALL